MKDTVVAIEYTIKTEDGDVVDTSDGRQPLVYLHGYQHIVPGVEDAIEGLEAGHTVAVSVTPESGYGNRDPNAILVLPRSAFPDNEDLTPGTMFRAFHSDGRPVIFSVVEAHSDAVIVDANHPLAGKTLTVSVAVVSVRTATEEERQHQHVHTNAPATDVS